MKIYGLRVFVDDLDAALGFYRDLLGLTVKWDMSDYGAIGFDLGVDLIIEREDLSGEDGNLVGRFVGVSISVDDIEDTYTSLRAAGVEFTGPPTTQPWGGVLAHFRDPAGNILTLLGSARA